ncbi:unnamed protein product [Peniophora sp. CBMAI 1063]|nr:unnamed protein product [Peniophora sp. CBMAI 1063]
MESGSTGSVYLSSSLWQKIRKWGDENLNFFKLHLMAFTIVPLICAGILYASNGLFPIRFIDALFICISATTGTGLTTVDLSALTAWQQVIIAALTIAGSPTTVAWIVVLVRKHYFTTHLDGIVKRELSRSPTASTLRLFDTLKAKSKDPRRRSQTFASRTLDSVELPRTTIPEVHVIPVSRQSSEIAAVDAFARPTGVGGAPKRPGPLAPLMVDNRSLVVPDTTGTPTLRVRPSPTSNGILTRSSTLMSPSSLYADDGIQRTASSVHFTQDANQDLRRRVLDPRLHSATRQQMEQLHIDAGLPPPAITPDDRGGFINPLGLLDASFKRVAPNLRTAIRRKLTMPAQETFSGAARNTSMDQEHGFGVWPPEVVRPGTHAERRVPYLSPGTSLSVRTGSTLSFESLAEQDYEELGGVEYQALRALLWLVPCFYLTTVALGFAVIAPYVAMSRWREIFLPPNLNRPLNSTWYSLFLIISAWANTGMSLVDQNLIPFQRAYPLLLTVIAVALLGETGFPAGLRFIVWALSKVTHRDGRTHAALRFLLDHPRRCFILLFPSRQTWFLLTVLIALNLTDWVAFMVLDIGIPEIEAIPLGVRALLGTVQAVALRIAGFTAFSLATLAPAMKILYLVMMYVAVYPVSMSVRATNVYEEQSLGIFEEEENKPWRDLENEAAYPESDGRIAIWGRYLGRHMRYQLSHDLWWLMLALIVVAVVERGNIRDPASDSWFNLFTIIFETVSAYTSVGLSFGIPTANYSLSGAFSTLSKVIMCAIMLRGRHRGLPLKVDRSIMLPREFEQNKREHLKRLRASRLGPASRFLDTGMARSISGFSRTPVSPTPERLATVKESADDEKDEGASDSAEEKRADRKIVE